MKLNFISFTSNANSQNGDGQTPNKTFPLKPSYRDGEYFLDFPFKVAATYGKLTVKVDVTHYAWPYIRMNDTFSVEKL